MSQTSKRKLKAPAPSGGYLFNLRVRLAELTPAEKSKVYHYVRQQTALSMRTIMRQKYLRADSPMKPNFEALAAFAASLHCTIDELKNK